MTNPTRTRAEILKDWVEAERERDTHVERIEELQEENTQAWPREGDKVALTGEVFRIPSPSHRGYGVRLNGDLSFGSTIAEYTEFIPAADLIHRAEHERLMAEALDAPKKPGKTLPAGCRDGVDYVIREYVLDDCDRGAQRQYIRDWEGEYYTVTVQRREAVKQSGPTICDLNQAADVLVCDHLLRQAPNYTTYTIQKGDRRFSVTVQRETGFTPGEEISRLRREIEELKATPMPEVEA